MSKVLDSIKSPMTTFLKYLLIFQNISYVKATNPNLEYCFVHQYAFNRTWV